ncbi:hypothetical protein BGX24_009941 [Mortierella sp. AD032]|nr:hypothetical protein BGX24_009941 [Mortierella sp. AD032]
MYQLPRLTNNTPTFLRDMIVSHEEPTLETLPLDPFAPPPPPPHPPPPHPPQPPMPLRVLNRFFHRTQMDIVQEQFQVMAIDAVEDNQVQDHQDHQDQDQDQDEDDDEDEDEDVEMMDDSVEEFGFEE